VVGAWELFEGWLFPVMDRNGLTLSLSLEDGLQSTVRGLCTVPKEPPHKW
jgi:hypothetical protein